MLDANGSAGGSALRVTGRHAGWGLALAAIASTALTAQSAVDPWGSWWLAEATRQVDQPQLALALARAAADRRWSPPAWAGLQSALDAHRPQATFALTGGQPASVSSSRSGLVAFDQAGPVVWWPQPEDSAPGGRMVRIPGEQAWIRAEPSPSGRSALLTAPGGWTGTELWDLTTAPPHRVAVLVGAVAARFSPRGDRVFAALRGGGIAEFDGRNGTEGATVAAEFPCTDLAVCPTGHVVGIGARGLVIVSPNRDIQFSPIAGDSGRAPILAADPRGPFVAVRGPGGLQALVVDVVRGAVRTECAPGPEPIRSLGFGPRGRWLWTLSGPAANPNQDRARFFDATTGQLRAVTAPGARAVAVSYSGRVAIAGAEYRPAERAPRGVAILAELPNPDAPMAAAKALTRTAASRLRGAGSPLTSVAFLGPDRVVTGDGDGRLRFWAWSSPREQRTLRGHREAPVMLSFVGPNRLVSGDLGRRLMSFERSPSAGAAAATWVASELELFESELVRIAPLPNPDPSLPGRAIAATESGRVTVYDLETGLPELEFEGHRDAVAALATRGDGLVASGSMAGRIALWSARDGKARWLDDDHRGPVFALAFSPDGRRLASAGHDVGVRVWDVRTGKLLGTGFGHRGMLDLVAWSPDGHQLASGGEDTVVRIWAVGANGRLIDDSARPLGGHVGGAAHLAFASSTQLVTAAADGNLRVWAAAEGTLRTTLAAHRPADSRRGSIRGLVATAGRILSVGADRTFCVYERTSPDAQHPWRATARLALDAPAVGLAAHPAAAAVALADGRIEIWPLDVRAIARLVAPTVSPNWAKRFGLPTPNPR